MAKTFDPNRVKPGTIELVRDSDGNYTSKVVGLETINSLSLPDISTTAAVTKTDTDTKNRLGTQMARVRSGQLKQKTYSGYDLGRNVTAQMGGLRMGIPRYGYAA